MKIIKTGILYYIEHTTQYTIVYYIIQEHTTQYTIVYYIIREHATQYTHHILISDHMIRVD